MQVFSYFVFHLKAEEHFLGKRQPLYSEAGIFFSRDPTLKIYFSGLWIVATKSFSW